MIDLLRPRNSHFSLKYSLELSRMKMNYVRIRRAGYSFSFGSKSAYNEQHRREQGCR